MNEYPSVKVSPLHFVRLHADYLPMLTRAPQTDFVVRTLAARKAGNTPLMTADLVIAGWSTRQTFPLALDYPLHFRKTYHPARLHADPRVEFEHQTLASTLIEVPAPIGFTYNTFRSCLLPGTPLNRLFELGVEPQERNITVARELSLPAAAGLWHLTEHAFSTVHKLQEGGLSHRDTHWHNFIVCASPLSVTPIDFERATTRDAVDAEAWERHCEADREHLLTLAVYLSCTLGRQRGVLGEMALAQLDTLVQPAETFRKAIDERTFAGGLT